MTQKIKKLATAGSTCRDIGAAREDRSAAHAEIYPRPADYITQRFASRSTPVMLAQRKSSIQRASHSLASLRLRTGPPLLDLWLGGLEASALRPTQDCHWIRAVKEHVFYAISLTIWFSPGLPERLAASYISCS